MGWFDKVKANTAVAIAISPIGNAIKGAKMVADGAKVAVEATGNFVEYLKAVPEAVAITAAVVLTAGTAAPVLIASGAPAVVITAATATANIANATSKVGVVSNIAMASTVPIGIDAPLSGVGAGSEYMQIEAEAAMLQDLAFGDINTPAENDLNTTTPGTVLPPENIGGPFKGAASPDLIAKNDAPTISAASQIDPTSSGETLTASFFQVAPSDEIRDLLKGTTLVDLFW